MQNNFQSLEQAGRSAAMPAFRYGERLFWVDLIFPTFDGHTGKGILALKGVCHGTQTIQEVQQGIQA